MPFLFFRCLFFFNFPPHIVKHDGEAKGMPKQRSITDWTTAIGSKQVNIGTVVYLNPRHPLHPSGVWMTIDLFSLISSHLSLKAEYRKS